MIRGGDLRNGDGLLLVEGDLFVIQNALEQLTKVALAADRARGRVRCRTTYPSFRFPTTTARAGGSLLVVNSQFDRAGPGTSPRLPFTVSRVRIPNC